MAFGRQTLNGNARPNFAGQYALGSPERSPNFGIAKPARTISYPNLGFNPPPPFPSLPGAGALAGGPSLNGNNGLGSGGYSGGSIDDNLLDDLDDISEEYSEDNYTELSSSLQEDLANEIDEYNNLEKIAEKQKQEIKDELDKLKDKKLDEKAKAQKKKELEEKLKEIERRQEENKQSINDALKKYTDSNDTDSNLSIDQFKDLDKATIKSELGELSDPSEEKKKDLTRLIRDSAAKHDEFADELNSRATEEDKGIIEKSKEAASQILQRDPSEIDKSLTSLAEITDRQDALTAQKTGLQNIINDPELPQDIRDAAARRLTKLDKEEQYFLRHQEEVMAKLKEDTALPVEDIKKLLANGSFKQIKSQRGSNIKEDTDPELSARIRAMMTFLRDYTKAIRAESEAQKSINTDPRQATDMAVTALGMEQINPLNSLSL